MNAAVVHSFDHPPRYGELPPPVPADERELLVDVLAAGLHPRVRSGAAGRHYTSTASLPFVPGVDGVGRLADGQRVYFSALESAHGTMAEQTVVDRRLCMPLSDQVDAATVAAAINPAMSSWLALRSRAPLAPGQSVLVLGATGNAGQMAVQIAKLLGAGRVIAAGRDPERLSALRELGADATVSIAGEPDQAGKALAESATEIDVVIDYLWGNPAELAIAALLKSRPSPDKLLRWVQIGAITGPTISLPSAALRSNNLQLLGSGQGSLSLPEILAELPGLIDAIASGSLSVDSLPIPLADVESAWNAPTRPGQRIVFLPTAATTG